MAEKYQEKFEFYKIPEWYNMYLNYDLLLLENRKIKDMIEDKKGCKLTGYYTYLFNSKKGENNGRPGVIRKL